MPPPTLNSEEPDLPSPRPGRPPVGEGPAAAVAVRLDE